MFPFAPDVQAEFLCRQCHVRAGLVTARETYPKTGA